jgi:hypothetical protein
MKSRTLSLIVLTIGATTAWAAEVESRRLTHYIPQDLLESAIRKEDWTEVPLKLKDGIRKGDTVRIWAGGSIDRGNGDQPGQHINGPQGTATDAVPADLKLVQDRQKAYALLFKSETSSTKCCLPPGQPLKIKMTKDNERLWVGFNDERGRYLDNHLGRGRRHELDPLWVRIEVVRTIVD